MDPDKPNMAKGHFVDRAIDDAGFILAGSTRSGQQLRTKSLPARRTQYRAIALLCQVETIWPTYRVPEARPKAHYSRGYTYSPNNWI